MPHGAIVNCGEQWEHATRRAAETGQEFPGLVGLDLAKDVTIHARCHRWNEMPWAWE